MEHRRELAGGRGRRAFHSGQPAVGSRQEVERPLGRVRRWLRRRSLRARRTQRRRRRTRHFVFRQRPRGDRCQRSLWADARIAAPHCAAGVAVCLLSHAMNLPQATHPAPRSQGQEAGNAPGRNGIVIAQRRITSTRSGTRHTATSPPPTSPPLPARSRDTRRARGQERTGASSAAQRTCLRHAG